MSFQYSPKNNPRVIIIQKLYGKYFNKDQELTIPKHRFRKFIKDIVNGTLEREDLINEEIKKNLNSDFNLKKLDSEINKISKVVKSSLNIRQVEKLLK